MASDAIMAMEILMDAWSERPDEGIMGRIKNHVEGELGSTWLVTLGTSHGTRPLSTWEAHDAAVLKMYASKQEAWGRVLQLLGWDRTEKGAFFLNRSASYGVTTYYTKTFICAGEWICGDGSYMWRSAPGEPELHVGGD